MGGIVSKAARRLSKAEKFNALLCANDTKATDQLCSCGNVGKPGRKLEKLPCPLSMPDFNVEPFKFDNVENSHYGGDKNERFYMSLFYEYHFLKIIKKRFSLDRIIYTGVHADRYN